MKTSNNNVIDGGILTEPKHPHEELCRIASEDVWMRKTNRRASDSNQEIHWNRPINK
jgi:hypothetical protein